MKKILALFIMCSVFLLLGAAMFSEDEKVVYITFDDGPTKNTPKILDTLSKYDAKATFFVLEDRIREFPDYMRRINAEGHAIGLHGVSHDYRTIYSTPAMPLHEMNSANDALFSVLGFRSRLVRTPYGSYPYMTDEQYRILCAAHFKLWDWTVDPRDSVGSSPSLDQMLARIRRDLKSAEPKIVILHDRKSTADALDAILNYFKTGGYSFALLDETAEPVNFMELYAHK